MLGNMVEHAYVLQQPSLHSIVGILLWISDVLLVRDNDHINDRLHSQSARSLQPVRFSVRSLGWMEIAEEELTPERSSRAVNRAIIDLSTGRNDIAMDSVAKWGDVRSGV